MQPVLTEVARAEVATATTPSAEVSRLSHATREKESRLVAWLAAQRSVMLGFSGGVDSAYLAAVATKTLGPSRFLAVIGRSPSYPDAQWDAARSLAAQFDIPVLEVNTHEMLDPNYVANPSNRCYFCKTELWSVLRTVAEERGLAAIIDGTNADDLGDWRPGRQAAREHDVSSPLADLGFTKDDIRTLSRERGLPTWSQPSSPCLSSRLPYGSAVTIERLEQVERAEAALRALGVQGDLRVRHHGDLARVELPAGQLDTWLAPHNLRALADAVRSAGFARVSLDLKGFRSGSLNIIGAAAGA
ncbi:MAG TPA: ATP-dependent sacrificial sulfur transferase LarE [Gemmatimonadaceae bacterium]|nr:ATP-dependent sacrificial sulfur transferase LarE [Gemmatimonadaceae bacterium]